MSPAGRSKGSRPIRILLSAFFLLTVLLPLLGMLLHIDAISFRSLIQSRSFSQAALRSVAVSAVATALSILLAYILAWNMARTRIRHKGALTVLLTLPMLIPSISQSTGLIMLFGANGLIKNLLGFSGNLYGFWGIVTGSVLYSFPFAFLMILDVLKYEDYTPYEAARVLRIPPWKQVRDLTLSYLRKPLIAVFFSTFTIIFTDYGVPIAIGGKYTTLPVIMYQEVIGQLNFSRGSVIGAILLLPAVLSFAADSLTKDKGSQAYVSQAFKVQKSPLRDLFAWFFCGLASTFVLLINLSFVLLAFTRQYPVHLDITLDNVKKTFNLNGLQYLGNSLLIAVLVALGGTFLAFVTAYLTAREPSWMSSALHLLSITSLAIPGLVLGIAYVLFFKSSFLYGSIGLLVMVNITHFIAPPYLMMYNSLGKMNENLEAVGDTLGVGRLRMVLDVFLPQVRSTLLEMASYLFVNSMITISAVSFLATTANKPFSLMINQFDALLLIECSAVVSLILLFVNILLKALIHTVKKRVIFQA